MARAHQFNRTDARLSICALVNCTEATGHIARAVAIDVSKPAPDFKCEVANLRTCAEFAEPCSPKSMRKRPK